MYAVGRQWADEARFLGGPRTDTRVEPEHETLMASGRLASKPSGTHGGAHVTVEFTGLQAVDRSEGTGDGPKRIDGIVGGGGERGVRVGPAGAGRGLRNVLPHGPGRFFGEAMVRSRRLDNRMRPPVVDGALAGWTRRSGDVGASARGGDAPGGRARHRRAGGGDRRTPARPGRPRRRSSAGLNQSRGCGAGEPACRTLGRGVPRAGASRGWSDRCWLERGERGGRKLPGCGEGNGGGGVVIGHRRLGNTNNVRQEANGNGGRLL